MTSKRANESEMKKELEKLPKRRKKCDVMIWVGEDSFPACKDVLTLRMEYFRRKFNAEIQEKDITKISIDSELVDPTIFDDFLDYVYTYNITFTPENLEPLYKAADHFHFEELKTEIESYMKDNINMDNVALFMNISTKYNVKIKEECQKFLISTSPLHPQAREAIGCLEYSELTSFLQKLCNLKKFENMFHWSIDWILHDEQTRSKRVSELLQMIPLRRLPTNFCKTVISKNALVRNDIKSLQLLLDSSSFLSEEVLDSANLPVEDLYVLGGCDGGTQISSVSKYDSATREWVELSQPMPQKLSSFGCCVVDQKIYVCGGLIGREAMNKHMHMFDTNSHQWTSLTAMKHPRYGCSMATLDGHLYVAGGCNQNGSLPCVERYSIQKKSWKEVSPMNHKRQGLELIQLNGFLYALGGLDGTHVMAIEQYNPQANEWTELAETNFPHGYFGSAVLNNRICVVGKDSCEEYSPEENKWRHMVSPKTKGLIGRRLAMFDGKLLAIGGVTEENNAKNKLQGIKTCESYDSEKRSWIASKDLNIARCYHGVAVVKRPPYTPE